MCALFWSLKVGLEKFHGARGQAQSWQETEEGTSRLEEVSLQLTPMEQKVRLSKKQGWHGLRTSQYKRKQARNPALHLS